MPFLWFGKKKTETSKSPAVLAPGPSDQATEAREFMAGGDYVAARLRLLPLLREEGEEGLRKAVTPLLSINEDRALAILNRAVTGSPNPGIFHMLRGLYYEAQGQWKLAIKDWDISARLIGDPDLLRTINERLARFSSSV